MLWNARPEAGKYESVSFPSECQKKEEHFSAHGLIFVLFQMSVDGSTAF